MQAKQIVSEIKHEGKIINDTNIISDTFNEYFVNVGPYLADKIPMEMLQILLLEVIWTAWQFNTLIRTKSPKSCQY